VLEQHDVVLGRQVRSIAGEDMGRVVNVVVDQSGQVRAAIIDFGASWGLATARSRSIGTRSTTLRPLRTTASRSISREIR
jgi:hypothetical protein